MAIEPTGADMAAARRAVHDACEEHNRLMQEGKDPASCCRTWSCGMWRWRLRGRGLEASKSESRTVPS